MMFILASDGAGDVPTVYEMHDGAVARCWAHTVEAARYAEIQALIDAASPEIIRASRQEATALSWQVPDVNLLRAAKVDAVNALRDQLLRDGAPFQSWRVAIDDTGRTDLGGMATTALATLAGALEWPAEYALGWIALDNTRIALPSPAHGLALADAAGRYYAAVVQAARTIKDAVLAATTAAEVGAVDITAGWPPV